MRIGELLLEAQLVTEDQISQALAHSDGLRLGSALIANRAVEPDVVARALAQQLGVPPAKTADLISIDPAARAVVPDALQKRLFAVPFKVHGAGAMRVLEVAMRDPENQAAINELHLAAGMKIDARVAPEVILKEALYPRAELPPPSAFEGPSSTPADDGGLELDLDRVKRPTGPQGGVHGRRGAAYVRPTHPPASAGATGGPKAVTGPGGAAAVLPPLQYDHDDPAKKIGQIFKLIFALGAIAAVVFVGLRFKKCMTSTTKAVGTHYDSKLLGVGIDFPEAGWRVAPQLKVDMGASRSEYFYRGGVPEVPVVTLVLARGPADDVGVAAQRALADLVTDSQVMGCEPSKDRAGAIVCKGGGTLMLFGRKRQNVIIDVHAWVIATGELMIAIMINPDYTLSETQYILSSIVEQ